ncbi:MAG: NlpC/P60 family protein [Desulfobacterales bacterium]|jgi:hypothetical protein
MHRAICPYWRGLFRRRFLLPFLIAGIVACAGGRGTTPPVEERAAPISLPTIHYTIQVGAFSTVERAARYADRLAAAGLDAYHFIDRDGLSKVRFERFATKAGARRRAALLRARGVIEDFYIVHPGAAAGRRQALPDKLVRTANRFIGAPYRWGGTSARSGFDCSGLTMTVYRLNGLELPRSARAQFDAGTPVSPNAVRQGDLVFFATGRSGRVSHVGIFTGGGEFIHAPGRGKTIRIASLGSDYFRSRYKGARRYF